MGKGTMNVNVTKLVEVKDLKIGDIVGKINFCLQDRDIQDILYYFLVVKIDINKKQKTRRIKFLETLGNEIDTITLTFANHQSMRIF